MTDENVFANYPEGFNEWNEKLFILFMEGVKDFPPELILGSIEVMKIMYLNRSANTPITQEDTQNNDKNESVE